MVICHSSCVHVSERKITITFFFFTQSGFMLFWLVIRFLIMYYNYIY